MKNWNNISDDELDKLFKQAADKEDTSFEAEAWGKMEQLLNEKEGDKKFGFWRKAGFALLALLFLGSIGIYLNSSSDTNLKTSLNTNSSSTKILGEVKKESIENNTKDKNSTETKNELTNPSEANLIAPEKAIKNKTDNFTDKLNTETSSSINAKPKNAEKIEKQVADNQLNTKNIAISQSNINKSKDKAQQQNFNSNTNLSTQNSKNKVFRANSESSDEIAEKLKPTKKPIDTKSDSDLIQEITENRISKTTEKTNAQSIQKNTKSNQESTPNSAYFEPSKTPNSNALQPNLGESIIETQVTKADLQLISLGYLRAKKAKLVYPSFYKALAIEAPNLPEKPAPTYFKKGLYLSANYSPDISTVGSNEITKIGSNYGAYLEYRLSKRFSIQAGVFKSIKYYDAYPEQYKWAWGTPPTPLKEIGAVCKMMDYPINLRYDINQNTKSRIYTIAGLTTYKMMEETYNYDYVDNSSPYIKHRYWKGKTGKTFMTSNLNLSIGFEKQLASRLSMQIEPFAKVPLKSIGFGKVPLISYGLMFSGKIPIVTFNK